MTDILFIPGKYNKKIIIPKNVMEKIPNKIILYSSVQFLGQLQDIEDQLKANNKSVQSVKSKNYLYDGMVSDKGQLLGCNLEDFAAKNIEFDAFMYIGDGKFHPKALLVNNDKDVYCFDPKTSKLTILDKNLHKEYQKRKKGAILKFLSSKNVGILISTKIGQSNPKSAKDLKKKILSKWPDKIVYTFFANDIDFSELENYNFIDIYINAACARIGYDDSLRTEKTIINIADVEMLLK